MGYEGNLSVECSMLRIFFFINTSQTSKDSYEIQNFALEDFTQDTTKVPVNKATKSQVKQICQSTYIKQRSQNTSEIHRDTTLGGSEHYNTYKKNEYGAGGVTTNARKK